MRKLRTKPRLNKRKLNKTNKKYEKTQKFYIPPQTYLTHYSQCVTFMHRVKKYTCFNPPPHHCPRAHRTGSTVASL